MRPHLPPFPVYFIHYIGRTWLSVACLHSVCRRQVRPPPPCIACAALASALASALAATSALTPPPPSPASASPRGRPSSLWLASGYHQGAGLNAGALCTRSPRQRTKQSAAAPPNSEKAKWPLNAFLCVRMLPHDVIIRVYALHMYAYKLLYIMLIYRCKV